MNHPDRLPQPPVPRKPWVRPALTTHGDARVLTEFQNFGKGRGQDGSKGSGLMGNGPAHS